MNFCKSAFFSLALLFMSSSVLAATFQIQFTGTVSRIDGNYSPVGISVGDDVSFTYSFDLDGVGYDGQGTKQDTQYYDYFYAEQVDGLRILGLDSATDTTRYAMRDTYNNQTYIRTGSYNELNDWWSAGESLPVGQYFYVGQAFYGNGGLLHPAGAGPGKPYAFVRYDLTVDSISEVPLPVAAWLFGSALLGLGVIKRQKA